MATIVVLAVGGLEPLIAAVAEEGHRVVEAYDSGHLLQLVMRGSPDVVVMPEIVDPVGGEETLPLIRRLTTAAILVVGPGNEVKMANALFYGADAYVRISRRCRQGPQTYSRSSASPRQTR